jgi:hypothetical protein
MLTQVLGQLLQNGLPQLVHGGRPVDYERHRRRFNLVGDNANLDIELAFWRA